MARPKSFDVDDALHRATTLFWSKGYEATSVRDLEEHLGVGRQSLYDTFGDKHALFIKALDHYTLVTERLRDGLRADDAGLTQIRAFFQGLVAFATPAGSRPGCLIVNTVAELGSGDEAASSICRRSRSSLARAFRDALANAAERGEITRPSSLAIAADYLVSQAFGMVLLAKGGASRKRLHAVVDQALRAIN